MTNTVLYRCGGLVGSLVLNCPERHNALGGEQLLAIRNVLRQVAADEKVRVLIITGAGDRTFCAGASLQELQTSDLPHDAFQQMTGELAELAIPTLCALNGDVFGGGVELAASCDFRIGVRGSRMRIPAAEIGLCYPMQGINRLVECMGFSTVRRLLLAAEEFDDEAMARIGFLDHVVERNRLVQFTADFAQYIASLAPLSVRAMKRLLRQASSGPVDAQLATRLAETCLASDDLREGLAAKRAKLIPNFKGC